MLRIRSLVLRLTPGALGRPSRSALPAPSVPRRLRPHRPRRRPFPISRSIRSTFGGLEARALGPAGDERPHRRHRRRAGPDPLTIWVGAASGGVWKSTDGGLTFKPVFDDHTQSIGALAIDPKDPKTVWVGTGESWTRNSVSVGDGVYKTTDGGDTWQRVGLEKTERIARIAVTPATATRSGSAPPATCGTPPGARRLQDDRRRQDLEEAPVTSTPGPAARTSRSTRRTRASSTPACGSSAAPRTPSPPAARAAASTSRPTAATPGASSSAGLPAGEQGAHRGRRRRPRGRAWSTPWSRRRRPRSTARTTSARAGSKVNTSFNLQVRPFYFAHLVVDPTDFNTVYKPGLTLTVSTDGGKSFNSPFSGGFGGGVHSDHHALWINPKNARRAAARHRRRRLHVRGRRPALAATCGACRCRSSTT